MAEASTCCAGASAGNPTGHYTITDTRVQDIQDLSDPLSDEELAHQGGRVIGTPTKYAQEGESALQPVLTATAVQHALTSSAGQPEALHKVASSFACAPQSGTAAAPAAHTCADTLIASEEGLTCAVEADSAACTDKPAAEPPTYADHHGIEPHNSISEQSSDASSPPAALLQLLQTSKDSPEGLNPIADPSTPAAVAAVLVGPALAVGTDLAVTHEATAALSAALELPPDTARDPPILSGPPVNAEDVTAADGVRAGSDLLQQQAHHESSDAPGTSAALQEADHMLAQTLSQTDAVPSFTSLSPAEHAAVMKQTAALELLGDIASPQVAASDICANSAPIHPVAMAAEGAADPSQPTPALLQLQSLQGTPTQLPLKLRSSETVALHRAVSESALLSDFAPESLDTPVKPKRRSLLSRLRPSKGSKGGSDLGRTASNPALLMRQSSADEEKLKSPTRRLSLTTLLRRGGSGNASAAVIAPTAVTSGGHAAAAIAAGASTDVVGRLARLSSGITTAGRDQTESSSPQQDATPLLVGATSSGTSSAQDSALLPQSAPASPRGRGGTAPPKGNAAQPDLALGRAVSDPSMLARLSSGMHSIPTTPRRMSLLGRLSRGRRSNSIMPEPSNGPMPGQVESAQEVSLEEVPFAEQPFAEQSCTEQPSAEQPFAEHPSIEDRLAEQPSAEQPSVEQPSAKQSLAEQPLAATSSPEGTQNLQQLHEEQPLADLAEFQDLAGESDTPPRHTHYCCISI